MLKDFYKFFKEYYLMGIKESLIGYNITKKEEDCYEERIESDAVE